jgi:hypothetical protein
MLHFDPDGGSKLLWNVGNIHHLETAIYTRDSTMDMNKREHSD